MEHNNSIKIRRTDMKKSIVRTGQKPGKGTYCCTNCHTCVNLDASDKMPPCPKCTNSEFTKN